MEYNPNISGKVLHQPSDMQNIILKTRKDDVFCKDNNSQPKGFLHQFQHLDLISMVESSFSPDLGIQTTGLTDPFDPFQNGSSSVGFDVFDFKPFVENEAKGNNPTKQENFEGGPGGNLFNFKSAKQTPLMDTNSSESNIIPPCIGVINPSNFSVANESGSITADSSGYRKKRGKRQNNIISISSSSSSLAKRKASGGRKKSKSAKEQWTIEEDRILTQVVEKLGEKKWACVAKMLKGRIGKQCRERWHNHLKPDIKKDLWTEEEDRVLVEAHAEIGNKWTEIAKRLPGRTENSIKNHWNATKRRQHSRKRCNSKWQKPSNLLQKYIRSLN